MKSLHDQKRESARTMGRKKCVCNIIIFIFCCYCLLTSYYRAIIIYYIGSVFIVSFVLNKIFGIQDLSLKPVNILFRRRWYHFIFTPVRSPISMHTIHNHANCALDYTHTLGAKSHIKFIWLLHLNSTLPLWTDCSILGVNLLYGEYGF